MAAIGSLHLGATADANGQLFPTAVACKLRLPIETPMKGTLEDGWQVESLANGRYICARHLCEMSVNAG